MQRFRFPLERLLWHRHLLEELAQQALAVTLETERRLASDLDRLRALARSGIGELHAALLHPTAGADLLLRIRFLAALEHQRGVLTARRRDTLCTLSQQRAALIERRRDREVIEQLRQRALTRHRRACEREERLALDEAASLRHAAREAQ
jgi:flagellar export protein FliJ